MLAVSKVGYMLTSSFGKMYLPSLYAGLLSVSPESYSNAWPSLTMVRPAVFLAIVVYRLTQAGGNTRTVWTISLTSAAAVI